MTPWSAGVTEEVLEIVREVSADPRSTLLRVPTRTARATQEPERVSVRMAGLTVAERHLLRVHREEVALLLRDLIRTEMTRSPGPRFVLLRDHEACRSRAATELAYRSAAGGDRKLRDLVVASGGRVSGITFLDQVLPGGGERMCLRDLALAGMQLEESVSNKILLATTFTDERQTKTARRILGSVAKDCPNPFKRSIAWSAIGIAYNREGRYRAGYVANREALRISPGQFLYAANCLSAAFRAQSVRLVREALGPLGELATPSLSLTYCVGIESQTKVHVARSRRSGDWTRLLEEMPLSARSIFDAVCA